MILDAYDHRGMVECSFARCDGCGAELPAEKDYMGAVLSKMKAGWKRVKDKDGVRRDYCQGCRAKRKEKA